MAADAPMPRRRRRRLHRLRGIVRPQIVHAAKVALAASLVVGVVYGASVALLDWVVSARMTHSTEARLADQLSDLQASGLRGRHLSDDNDGTPVYAWVMTRRGPTPLAGSAAPVLPAGLRLPPGRPRQIQLAPATFLLTAGTVGGDTVIVGQSMENDDHLLALLVLGEALAAPFLLLTMFAGALIIGMRALSPVERARRRQLEFTADASHELRTPLSVIAAETAVTLSAPRDAADYRATLVRIDRESARLRKIVEDLLWLARFDSAPPQPEDEPLDLSWIAAECAERFRVLSATTQLKLLVRNTGPRRTLISAPPDWIDRLAGVLVDNACRFAGSDGTVRISVGQRGSRVTLTVEDSGPGVPAIMRSTIFDRFHRSAEQGGSAGLGLAIADSIVRSTDGQWRLADSDLGGALFEVSWRRTGGRRTAAKATEAAGQAQHAYQPAPRP